MFVESIERHGFINYAFKDYIEHKDGSFGDKPVDKEMGIIDKFLLATGMWKLINDINESVVLDIKILNNIKEHQSSCLEDPSSIENLDHERFVFSWYNIFYNQYGTLLKNYAQPNFKNYIIKWCTQYKFAIETKKKILASEI